MNLLDLIDYAIYIFHVCVYKYKKPIILFCLLDRIKKISLEILAEYRDKFDTDFADNKVALGKISIVRSKELRNKLAGYITRMIRREKEQLEFKRKQESEQESMNQVEEVPTSESKNADKPADN